MTDLNPEVPFDLGIWTQSRPRKKVKSLSLKKKERGGSISSFVSPNKYWARGRLMAGNTPLALYTYYFLVCSIDHIYIYIYTEYYKIILQRKHQCHAKHLAPSTLAGLHIMGVVPPCSRVDHRSEYKRDRNLWSYDEGHG